MDFIQLRQRADGDYSIKLDQRGYLIALPLLTAYLSETSSIATELIPVRAVDQALIRLRDSIK